MDPYQARHYVGPDLGPNCLQRLSAGKALKVVIAKNAHVDFFDVQEFSKSAYQNKNSYFSTKTYVVGTQKNRLNEMVLLNTQNLCEN